MRDLEQQQVALERAARDMTIRKIEGQLEGNQRSDSLVSMMLIRSFINPMAEKLRAFIEESASGGPGRRNRVWHLLHELDPHAACLIAIKVLVFRMGTPTSRANRPTVTNVAIQVGDRLMDEVRIRKFEEDHPEYFEKMWSDFNRRELPRNKREAYLQGVLKEMNEAWVVWSTPDRLHVGLKMIEIFKEVTQSIDICHVTRPTTGGSRRYTDILVANENFLKLIDHFKDQAGYITSFYFPMVVPPRPWTPETLDLGAYITHLTPTYPLVKYAPKKYLKLLQERAAEGQLDVPLRAINAVQETPWRVNTRVLEVLKEVYEKNLGVGGFPPSDVVPPPEPETDVWALPKDDPERRQFMSLLAENHELNRRMVGKRIIAFRSISMAQRFEEFDEFYFPHSLDSRGRVYPLPSGLTPQGTDYVKALLEFADGKALTKEGLYWLGVHGANCWGEDKEAIDQREAWTRTHIDQIRSVARDPLGDLWWTHADSPFQFLAFCFEYAEAEEGYLSHLPVALDATCSGLQHFSAMLLDPVGGFHVNMMPGSVRQDVYAAVAKEAHEALTELHDDPLAEAWVASGFMDRKVAKRPVMVKPYSGTYESCKMYVNDAVDEKLAGGHPLPVSEDALWQFKVLGSKVVWQAIPKVVIAADEAMRWLSKLAYLVGKSQGDQKAIHWTAPTGFPVRISKMEQKSRQITTRFDGSVYRPRYNIETDEMDPNKMRSAVPPSFVHSLDAAHLMLTVDKASGEGIRHFAMVHDSFGVHASDIPRFKDIIRETFVEMYSKHDVLAEFLGCIEPLISEEFKDEIPEMPSKGTLRIEGVLENPYFFS